MKGNSKGKLESAVWGAACRRQLGPVGVGDCQELNEGWLGRGTAAGCQVIHYPGRSSEAASWVTLATLSPSESKVVFFFFPVIHF